MIRQLTRPLLRPLLRPLVGKGGCERWVYNFDGVDDFGVFAERLIDPDGDIDIEFYTPSVIGAGRQSVILTQSVATSQTAKEFDLFLSSSSGNLGLTIGGVTVAVANAGTFIASEPLRLSVIGTQARILRGETVVRETSISRGAAREPLAPTRLGASGIGTNFFIGPQYDIRINGQLYPINNPNSNIQTSVPDNGNPLTLVNTNQQRWSKIPC